MINEQAVCSCLLEYVGSPPGCRPECVVSSECPKNKACSNKKCVDPCPGLCGLGTICRVLNHSPICACEVEFTGDPFVRCFPTPSKIIIHSRLERLTPYEKQKHIISEPQPTLNVKEDPCTPSPCGPYSECRNTGDVASCSCSINYIGVPPNCRPECIIGSDCPANMACINEKCRDPCPGSCGFGARCNVINHTPTCSCPEGFTGDPFTNCQLLPQNRKDKLPFDVFRKNIMIPWLQL